MKISEIAQRIQTGQLKPSDLTARCLARIDALEPRIHAWVCVDRDRAMSDAKALDAELAQGRCRGELHGIPVGVKDIADVRGLPTRAGSPLTSEAPAAKDAEIVSRLRDAGAVILGKTVTTEYASFDPPPTRNPWNLDHTPGGSSSGSATAVAVGMCVAAIGTQTGGSIIRPASYCGVYGFKPSFGRLSLEGIVPFSLPLDHPGPIAGCAGDLEIMFRAMGGSGDGDAPDILPFTTPLRLGILESYFLEQADAIVVTSTRDAVARLQAAGARVSEAELPEEFRDVHRMHRILMAGGAAIHHREQFQSHSDKYGREIATLLREGLTIDSATYQQALDHQQLLRREMSQLFRTTDILVTPATPTPAPSVETTGDPKFNSPWSYTGLPSVSLPCAVSDRGLPMSVQIIGPFGSDYQLLTAARWIEAQLAFVGRPPIAMGGLLNG